MAEEKVRKITTGPSLGGEDFVVKPTDDFVKAVNKVASLANKGQGVESYLVLVDGEEIDPRKPPETIGDVVGEIRLERYDEAGTHGKSGWLWF